MPLERTSDPRNGVERAVACLREGREPPNAAWAPPPNISKAVGAAFAQQAVTVYYTAGEADRELASYCATHACAAKVVLIRHKFRRATPKERRPSRDRASTACHDAAQLCGDTRWRLVFQLAKEVPEDVGSAEATGANGGETKKKSRRNVVGKFGCNDRVLFDAALGLAGFDKEFELGRVGTSIGAKD